MAECQFIKRKEPSKKQDQSPILNLSTIRLELEESELEEVTTSLEPSDLKKVISTGLLNQSPEKQEFWMSYTMPQTTSSLEPKLSSKTVSSKLMPPHSLNGTRTIMVSILLPRKVKKPKLKKKRDQKEDKTELMKD